ncbi:methyltransferase-like protein 13 [Selaginella moellendorffii]|uniref:methyltransferase-like protein 13 n=1 Tax=Selaginella moellendorffii TaxID=88036 RepID=UPI000D1CFAB2|nr:methyltransferase-like protein 13 [Selaginella moellendorffii]|eukprot:XP_024531063.1 methyltransferase-like protein 13 [Selaginella moellendorffii]
MGDNALPNRSFKEQRFWDEFLVARDGLPFEWYAQWSDLFPLLERHCGLNPQLSPLPAVLIPGCGNSELSSAMYDHGFTNITNIDFSRSVIMEMMRRNIRDRPMMFWKVMDMTEMQFSNDSFDYILDKGALDAVLGQADEDHASGKRFLSEVKRVLRPLGKYACITLAESHVIGLLLSTFRHGWQVAVYQVPIAQASSKLKPLLFAATKETTSNLSLISYNLSSDLHAQNIAAIEKENALRRRGPEFRDFEKLQPSRRSVLTLGGTFKAIVLDAKIGQAVTPDACAVFLVPKAKAHEWLYSSEEGQWQVVESAKAARLIMVYLETDCQTATELQNLLSPLVRELVPLDCDSGVPFLLPHDGVCKGTLLEEIDSPLTGTMLVEDVVSSDKKKAFFRRLFFKRNPNLIQSEALLTPTNGFRRVGSKKKNKHGKETAAQRRQNTTDEMKVDHSYLASPYHEGMVAGLSLIATKIESCVSSKEQIRVMIVGLGAGLLPMFLYKHFPFNSIEVVELDPVVADLAKRHFGFVEDDRMQLRLGDGLAAVDAIAKQEMEEQANSENTRHKLHILLIDADSSDPSNGLSCPPEEFLLETFLRSAKAALEPEGILVINVVSRAREPHIQADQRMCKIFSEVYSLQVDEDVNRVVFGLPQPSNLRDSTAIFNAGVLLKKVAGQFASWDKGPNVKDVLKKIKRIK